MKSRILLLIGAVGMLGMLAGCPPSYPNCNDTDDCVVDGQQMGVCVAGTCRECAVDSDCGQAGFKCENNTCVPAAECQTNAECDSGKACVNGKCQACTSDAQCGPDGECRNGACAPNVCTTDDDCGEGRACIEGRCRTAPRVDCQPPSPIRFPFNESTLTSDAQGSLDELASCLNQGAARTGAVTIEGHADERGTDEYNIALGERRAQAVKRYLRTAGVDESRMRTVSYGEERPVAYGSDESAYEQNRRAEFQVQISR